MEELTREFLIESQEGLDRMERCLTELESKPGDSALLADIFRSVHTIKGTTGFLGFKRLETLAHAGENLLGLLRDGKLAATGQIITGLLHLLDGLRSILKTIEAEENEGSGGDDALIAELQQLQNPLSAVLKIAPKTRRAATVRTVRRSKTAAAATSEPMVERNETATAPVLAAKETESSISGGCAEQPAAGAAPRPATAAATAAESTLRVDVALLNRMMNLVGELVLTRNQVLQTTASNPAMTLLSRRLDMVTADLRESVMKARMQPVSHIFSKIPRIVRDISQSLGKRVALEMEGQETELDKSLLEAIKDPITHAVRNALDHGIEPPEARIAAGKPAEGTLKLRATHQGSHVIIDITDDGAGISTEKVRSKAIERGLTTARHAALLSERELLQMIFLPGFSTASAVTNVSGRGVGMDVVRTNVEKIGGKAEIESRPCQGTTLRLRIPLTLAIIPALIVRSLGQSFALPQGALSELVHVPPEQAAAVIEWIDNAPVYRLRGRLLPLVYLHRMLAPGESFQPAADAGQFIAVLDVDGRRYGLVVDGLADPEEIVVKPLSGVLKGIGLYSGATVLGNAELALILDPGAIAAKAGITLHAEAGGGASELGGAEAGKANRVEYLLVEIGGRQSAIPLKDVLRIEQVRLARIEFLADRPVLNLDGQLLPVEDSGGLIPSLGGQPDAQMVVVVCRQGKRHVGIAASHVLDVAAGGELMEAGTQAAAEGVTLLKDRITQFVRFEDAAELPGEMETEPVEELVEGLV